MRRSRKVHNILGISSIEYLLGILLSLVIAGFLVAPAIYKHSSLGVYLSYEKQHPSAVNRTYTDVQQKMSQSKFAADATVFIFWSIIGLFVYAVLSMLYRSAERLKEFHTQVKTTPFDKRFIIKEAVARLGLRVASLLLVYLLFIGLLDYTLPLMVYAFEQSPALNYWTIVTYLATAVFVFLFIHIVVVLARLFMLRIRLFDKAPDELDLVSAT